MKEGIRIENDIEKPTNSPFQYKRSKQETEIMNEQIKKLLDMQVISETTDQEGFFSNLFTKRKSDGSYRSILNLKNFNNFCEKKKFKMCTLRQVIQLITPNAYMASLDIEQAYFSIPIHENHKKYLKFSWGGEILCL